LLTAGHKLEPQGCSNEKQIFDVTDMYEFKASELLFAFGI
jgi:hypothetical protein